LITWKLTWNLRKSIKIPPLCASAGSKSTHTGGEFLLPDGESTKP
jgi:hypothetical protein